MTDSTHDQLYDAFGAYVRSQRLLAQLTLRQAAKLASISNPYLSQIEHGLALPSVAVLSALANALSVSAETMLMRAAGISQPNSVRRPGQTEESIRQDPRLDNTQKHALLAVLSSFVGSSPTAVPGAFPNASNATLHAVAPPDSPASTSARPATAGRGAGSRQKGV